MVRDGKVRHIPKSWDKIGEEQLRLYAQELAKLYHQEHELRQELGKRSEDLSKERAWLQTEIAERRLVEEELKDRTNKLAALHRVSLAMGLTLDLATISNIALVTALVALGLDAGTIRYLDEFTQELVPMAFYGLPSELAREIQSRPRMKIGQGLAGKVAELSEVKVIENLDLHEWEFYKMAAQAGFKSYAGLPLKAKDKFVGVIAAFSYRRRTFTEADLDMLTDLGNMLGTYMENSRLFEQIEAKAREWEKTFDTISDGISIHSLDFRILRANNSLARMLGDTTKSLVGQHCYKAIHGLDRPIANCPLACVKLEKQAADLVRQEPGMGNRWLQIRCSPVIGPQGQMVSIVHTVQDITEQKQAEEELRNSREQLRNLTANLQAAREEERRNIASNLHDDLGQTLTALQINLSWLINKMPKDHKSLLQKAKSMLKLIDGADETVTRVCMELRPRLLDDLGLISAIQWQIKEFERQAGIKCELTIDSEDIVLDKDRSIAYFRILQEALTNVVKHANATHVSVNLAKTADKLLMEVIDNGKGITELEMLNSKSLGLIGMRERAYFMGGDLEIKGTPNGGTTLRVIAPFKGGKQ